MKRQVFIAVLAVAVLAPLAAEGKQEASISAGPEKITYYLWEDPTYMSIIEQFNRNAEKTGVTVNAMQIPSGEYETKITTMLAGGIAMDAYMQKRQTDMFVHNANGHIAPLDDLMKKHGFDPSIMGSYGQQVTVDGKTLGIPFRGASYYVYYNRKLLEKAGIPSLNTYVEKGEWTWSKFREVANKISSGDGKPYGAIIYTWGATQMIPAFQRNVIFITADGKIQVDDSVLAGFRLRKELEAKKAIMPLLEMRVTRTHYSKPFYEGNAGMLVIGEWFPGYMLTGRKDNLLKGFTWDDWGITRLPCDEKTYATFGASTFNHIHAGSTKKDASFKFISWMGGPEGAEVVARAGFLPAVITPNVIEILKQNVPDAESLKYFTEKVRVNAAWYTKYGSKVEQLVANTMDEYLGADLSDKDLMVRFTKGLEEIIATTN